MSDYDTIYREGYEEGVCEIKAEMEKMKAEMEKLKEKLDGVKEILQTETLATGIENRFYEILNDEESDEDEEEDEEECVPRCDFCKVSEEDIRYYQGGDMWNGDTGCCVACEKKHDC